MSIAQKLTTIAENQEKIYNKGKNEGLKEGYINCESNFWDYMQNFGKRTDYARAFYNWAGPEYIRPKYKVIPKSASPYLFSDCANLKALEKDYFDFSQLPENYTEYNQGLYRLCNNCTSLEIVEDVNFQPIMSYSYFFGGCENLKTIEILRVSEKSGFGGTMGGDCFWHCYSLEDVTFEGTIGRNISFSFCKNLSHKSLMNVIECLKDYSDDTSGTIYTLTLGKENTAKLTEAQQQIAIDKGWVLA